MSHYHHFPTIWMINFWEHLLVNALVVLVKVEHASETLLLVPHSFDTLVVQTLETVLAFARHLGSEPQVVEFKLV